MYRISGDLEMAEASIFIGFNELKKRNILVNGRRTSVTLEPQVWSILNGVAEDRNCDVNELCSYIFERKSPDSSLASAIRVFLLSYLHITTKKGS